MSIVQEVFDFIKETVRSVAEEESRSEERGLDKGVDGAIAIIYPIGGTLA
jgi:hypothetical protein